MTSAPCTVISSPRPSARSPISRRTPSGSGAAGRRVSTAASCPSACRRGTTTRPSTPVHAQDGRHSVNDTPSMQVVLAVFAAVERRDEAAFARSCQPDAEFCWPPSLPYGRTVRGLTDRAGAGWEAYWNPLQPRAGHRRLDPRVIAATEEEVVVLWRQRGVTPAGDSIDTEVLGLYRVRAGKLARAQMFYFDPASVISFLAKAIPAGRTKPPVRETRPLAHA